MSRDYSAPFRIAGSRGSSISLPDTQDTHDSIRPVADLLLEAAYADGEFCEAERVTVRGLLCQLVGKDTLPEALERQLAGFDPARFDLTKVVEDFRAHAHTSDERMLQLVRKVC